MTRAVRHPPLRRLSKSVRTHDERAGRSSCASTQLCELRAFRVVRECRLVRGPRAFGRPCAYRQSRMYRASRACRCHRLRRASCVSHETGVSRALMQCRGARAPRESRGLRDVRTRRSPDDTYVRRTDGLLVRRPARWLAASNWARVMGMTEPRWTWPPSPARHCHAHAYEPAGAGMRNHLPGGRRIPAKAGISQGCSMATHAHPGWYGWGASRS